MDPFFVVGSERSGSTLLRLMLGHHSAICRCEEMQFVVGKIVDQNTKSDPSAYIHRLKLDRSFRLSGYTVNEALSYPEIAQDFLVQRQRIDGQPLVGATVHHAFEKLPEIWPTAKYIFLRRDPRDVARSCVQMGWSGTPWRGVNVWLSAEKSWQALQQIITKDQFIAVSFEELMADTPARLSEICDFLGVQYEPGMLSIDEDTTYSRPDSSVARSWRDNASDDEIAQVEARVGLQTLAALGYEASGKPPLKQNAFNQCRLAILELTRRTSAKVNRYGIGLWFAGVVSRRLPFIRWRESIQLKVDHIDNQHLK